MTRLAVGIEEAIAWLIRAIRLVTKNEPPSRASSYWLLVGNEGR